MLLPHCRTAALSLCAAALPLCLAACAGDLSAPLDPPTGQPSVALSTWKPGAGDSCPVEVHNGYSTTGPDGKRYPTWHPPVDPATGCTFGHEHGRDPHGSALCDVVGDIPFGFANEQLDIWDPNSRRHEDHVGHKVEWENNVHMSFGGLAGEVLDLRCDILVKLHQGTHSKDAFTNNLHELVYHIKCTDGSEIHSTFMAAIGKPGEFVSACDGARLQVGTATPANSPEGGGQRWIPARSCVNQHVLVPAPQSSHFGNGLHESWEIMGALKAEDGHTIASFNPYFQVNLPSRFYDPGLADITGRTINLCYEVEANGDRAFGGGCQAATANGGIPGLTQTDTRSPFNGVSRFVDINSNAINNRDGPETWYTDPFGRHGSRSAFPGSIRQRVSSTSTAGVSFHGPRLGGDRNYGGVGVHAPN